MSFDPSKAQFIRLGNCETEFITLENLNRTRLTIRFSESVRYLGFFLKDKIGINMEHHFGERCSPDAMKKEVGVLKWCRDNYYFNNSVRRSIVLTRSIPKLCFGVQGIIACTELATFKETYMKHGWVRDKETNNMKWVEKLHPYWIRWTGMDAYNIKLCELSKTLTKGMSIPIMTAAFYWLKPLHTVGMCARMKDIRDYWLRLFPSNLVEVKKYFVCNIPIINAIHFRKYRLPNVHLLTALLCGHYTKWLRSVGYRADRPLGWNCLRCLRPYTEANYVMNDNCVCCLAIPGQVPPDYPWLEEHYVFLRWLNRLSSHEMFKTWRKDPQYQLDPSITGDNQFDYDGTVNCITAYTDGSYEADKAGYGVWFDPETINKDSMCGRSPGLQTNNRAELYAILKGLKECKYERRSIRIYSDSSYAIYTISMYFRRYLATGVDINKLKIKNSDLLGKIAATIKSIEPSRVFLTKVKAHSNIMGNEYADWLSKAGRENGVLAVAEAEYSASEDDSEL